MAAEEIESRIEIDPRVNLLTRLYREREKDLSKCSLGNPNTWSSTWPPLMLTITETFESKVESTNDSGPAVIDFKNKSNYKGPMDKGILHGEGGHYKWIDGTIYEGQFTDNKVTGYGVYHWPDGSWYEGQLVNGLRHGIGTFHCISSNSEGEGEGEGNEMTYTGEWFMGKRHGKGKLAYNDGSFYDGQWDTNIQCGMGTRQYRSGNLYEGMWKNGRRHGNGTMCWKDRGEQYSGEWNNGIQHGKGEHIWTMFATDNSQYPLFNHYVGEWKDGVRDGWGTFYYASGGHFEGVWVANKKNGRGQYTLPNGRVIEGMYRDDKLVSQVGGNGHGSNDRPSTPLGNAIGDIDEEERGSATQQFQLCVSQLIPSTYNNSNSSIVTDEMKKLHSVILRYLTQLRKIYHMYSSLGTKDSSKLMKRIQMWQFLKDCELHRHGLTLTCVDSIISSAVTARRKGEEQRRNEIFGSDVFLMRELLQCLVFLSHRIYCKGKEYRTGQLSHSLDLFMRQDCLPRACKITGQYYSSIEVFTALQPYIDVIKKAYIRIISERGGGKDVTPSCSLRQFISFAKVDIGGGYLTAKDIIGTAIIIQPLALDSEGEYYNVKLPLIFLEFLEGLIDLGVQWYEKHHTTAVLMIKEKEERLERERLEKKEKEEEKKIDIQNEENQDELVEHIEIEEEKIQEKEEITDDNVEDKEEIMQKEEDLEIEEEKRMDTNSSVMDTTGIDHIMDTFFKQGLKNII